MVSEGTAEKKFRVLPLKTVAGQDDTAIHEWRRTLAVDTKEACPRHPSILNITNSIENFQLFPNKIP